MVRTARSSHRHHGRSVWSPRGNQIAFATQNLAGLSGYEIRRKPTNMAGAEELLLRTADVVTIWDWSPDGKFLVFTVQRGGDLMLLPLEGARTPELFAKTPGDGRYGQFSPDGKWMAHSAASVVFEAGTTRTALFGVPAPGNVEHYTYQPSKDGQQFPVNVPRAGVSQPIAVVLHWDASLKQ